MTNQIFKLAVRTLFSICAAGLLHQPASAMVVHLCSAGVYTQTEIYFSPVPLPNGSWRSTTTRMGFCSGEWSYVQDAIVASPKPVVGVSETSSGKTFPATDAVVVNLTAALTRANPVSQRSVSTREISESEARAVLSLAQNSRTLTLRLPRAMTTDPRCPVPFTWNGFDCVDNSTSPTTLPSPVPIPPSAL